MLSQHRRALANTVQVFDTVALLSGVAVAMAAAPWPRWPVVLSGGAAAVAGWTWLSRLTDLYRPRRTGGLIAEQITLAMAAALSLAAALVVVAAADGPRQIAFARALLVVLASMGGSRLVVRYGLRKARRQGRNTRTVLLVGRGRTGRKVADDYQRHPAWGIQVLGELHFSGEETMPVADGVQALGPVARLQPILAEHTVDEVLVCPSDTVWSTEVRSVLRFIQAVGITCRVAPDFLGLPADRTVVADTAHVPTYVVRGGFAEERGLGCKRLIDVVGACLALLVLAPMLGAIAMAIALTSPGPILFRQQRAGLHGRPFTLLKFRSMVADAEARRGDVLAANEQAGPVFKMQRDPRVTAVGRWLRRYSLDELPQLWNVLRGDMSLVGPRPPIPSEVSEYDWWQRRRLSVRPGLTCIWQVSGRNAIPFDQWMELDMEYIDGWSLGMDLRIMAKTVKEVLRGGGV